MRLIVVCTLLWSCTRVTPDTPTTDPTTPAQGCGDEAALADLRTAHAAWFTALSEGVSSPVVGRRLLEDTNGSLAVGLAGGALPLLTGASGVHAAATSLGEGRVVAFSGQDFLSSGTRSTLLDEAGVQQLLRNAVAWAGGEGSQSLLVASDAVGAVLTKGTGHTSVTTEIKEARGLREIRDWSAEAVDGFDVLVVQVNEWGTLMVADEDVPAIRAFVEAGGGLLVAGSALHWSWWLSEQSEAFPGDALLEDVGIRWDRVSQTDMTEAELSYDPARTPEALWCAYVNGASVEDDALPLLAPLFPAAQDADRRLEVQAGLTRLVAETPSLPVSSADPAARLAADVLVGLPGVPWPSPHDWATSHPGAVDSGTARIDWTTEVDTTYTRDRPLGAYAAPGDAVTVRIDPALAGQGLAVRIGDRHDDLTTIGTIDEWRRAPRTTASVPLDAATTQVGTGLGGPVWLDVPDTFGAASVTVTLEGVVPMPVYTHGITDPSEFAGGLDNGAPQAIIEQPGNIRLVVSTAAAATADPAAVMDFWGPFYDRHADLAQEPTPRRYASTWLFDPQVGWGYANATPARINHPREAEVWALLLTPEEERDYWLFGHELGHQFQTSDWTGGDVTEVCVNLWTMYTLNTYLEGGDDFAVGYRLGPVDHAGLEGSTWSGSDLFGKLQLYRQLVDAFGWSTVRTVMASYYDPATYPRGTYGGFMDGFALRMSAVTGRDLTDFLDRWEYPITDGARTTIQSWGQPSWLPPGWSE